MNSLPNTGGTPIDPIEGPIDEAAVEARLLATLRRGDRDAFRNIYDYYFTTVAGSIDSDVAARAGKSREDIVQETFFELWHHYEEINNLRGFLLTVARNRLKDCARHGDVRSKTFPEIAVRNAALKSSSEDALVKREQGQWTRDALANLPDTCREVVRLYSEDVPYDRIASILGLPSANAAKKRLWNGIALLRKAYRERFGGHGGTK